MIVNILIIGGVFIGLSVFAFWISVTVDDWIYGIKKPDKEQQMINAMTPREYTDWRNAIDELDKEFPGFRYLEER